MQTNSQEYMRGLLGYALLMDVIVFLVSIFFTGYIEGMSTGQSLVIASIAFTLSFVVTTYSIKCIGHWVEYAAMLENEKKALQSQVNKFEAKERFTTKLS